MASDGDLKAFDDSIRKMRVEYELYFSGQRKRPPEDERRSLDQLARRLSAAAWKTSAERFLYGNLVGRYNLYCELWEKQLREREEGPRDPRKRRAALSGPAPTVPQPAPSPPVPAAPANAPARSTVEIRVGGDTGDASRKIFERYVAAREQSGEGAGVGFDRFRKLIDDQVAALSRKTGSDAVEFDVKIADGKVKLVAKPKGRA
jgi:hypothetical protein